MCILGGTVYLHPLEIRPRVVVISNGNPTDKSDPKETTTNSKAGCYLSLSLSLSKVIEYLQAFMCVG